MIKSVYRVQCDGPGCEWLSLRAEYVPGAVIEPEDVVAASTAEHACNFPNWDSARRGAIGAQWSPVPGTGLEKWLCPGCRDEIPEIVR